MAESSELRKLHYKEFMEQVLGILPTTPLADVRYEVIIAAGRAPSGAYVQILERALDEARATANRVDRYEPAPAPLPQAPSGSFNYVGKPISMVGTYNRSGSKVPGPGSTQVNRPPPPQDILPSTLRRILDQTIVKRNLPENMIENARFAGNAAITSSDNFRVDVSGWSFPTLAPKSVYDRDQGGLESVPLTLPSFVAELFREVKEIGYISSQVMEYSWPCIMRLVFYTEKGAKMFLAALEVKSAHIFLPTSDRQWPVVSSHQPAHQAAYQVEALIDTFRPSKHQEPHPADRLRQYGRLTPAPLLRDSVHREIPSRKEDQRGCKREHSLSEGEIEGSKSGGHVRGKRMHAADFMDVGNIA